VSDLDRTFAALADPTRRGVRVLRATGLVEEDHQDGDARVRLYRLRPGPFRGLRRWLDEVELFWADELGAFKQYAERTRGRRNER
jgi:hypothetical protein